jgi:hypothetical protein
MIYLSRSFVWFIAAALTVNGVYLVAAGLHVHDAITVLLGLACMVADAYLFFRLYESYVGEPK